MTEWERALIDYHNCLVDISEVSGSGSMNTVKTAARLILEKHSATINRIVEDEHNAVNTLEVPKAPKE